MQENEKNIYTTSVEEVDFEVICNTIRMFLKKQNISHVTAVYMLAQVCNLFAIKLADLYKFDKSIVKTLYADNEQNNEKVQCINLWNNLRLAVQEKIAEENKKKEKKND